MPTRPLDVALYLEHLFQGDTSSSVLHSASGGISWANKLYGFPDPCQDPLVKNILEAGVRCSAKPVVKKEPITPEMISSICSKYASPSANLSTGSPHIRLEQTTFIGRVLCFVSANFYYGRGTRGLLV